MLGNAVCYQPPLPRTFSCLLQTWARRWNGRSADGRSNLQSDKKPWLARTVPVSIDQCRRKPGKNSTAAYKWLDAACWDGKIYLSREKNHKGICQRSEVFKVPFELYLACVINGRIQAFRAVLLFSRDGREKAHWLAEGERSGGALEDAVKRIRWKDFTIFLVQMGSLKLQFTHLCGSQRCLAE